MWNKLFCPVATECPKQRWPFIAFQALTISRSDKSSTVVKIIAVGCNSHTQHLITLCGQSSKLSVLNFAKRRVFFNTTRQRRKTVIRSNVHHSSWVKSGVSFQPGPENQVQLTASYFPRRRILQTNGTIT
jgi:hypothetical protein